MIHEIDSVQYRSLPVMQQAMMRLAVFAFVTGLLLFVVVLIAGKHEAVHTVSS